MNSRKSFLFSVKEVWIKKGRSGNNSFDVPMGSNDGAEICEFVGLFLLNQMGNIVVKSDYGIYRDDGLCTLKGPKREIGKTRKNISQIFKNNGLAIDDVVIAKQVDYLDITMNLTDEIFWPYRKENSEPIYVNVNSNHPPGIIKNLPIIINKRLSELSSNEEQFNNCKQVYQKALDKCGYNHKLKYAVNEPRTRGRGRKRKITWFNPPYDK